MQERISRNDKDPVKDPEEEKYAADERQDEAVPCTLTSNGNYQWYKPYPCQKTQIEIRK